MRRLTYAILISAGLLASCGSQEPAKTGAAPAAAISVQTSTAALQEWSQTYEATGTVRATATGTVTSKVMGYVKAVNAQVGDKVNAGQLLIVLDARDLENGVRRAEAGVAEVESAVPEAESAMAAAKANLDLAQTTFKRMEELANKKSISSQEFDEASARVKAAQANYEMARAKRTQLQSKIAQAREERAGTMIMRDYTNIAAPFAGIVTAKSVEPGNLATPGAPLLTIEREGRYRLEASVDESRLPSVKTGQPVEVSLDALGRTLNGRVTEIVPSVDAASRTYTVKIDLPPAGQLRSGAFGRAVFSLGSRKVLAVPSTALVERGQLQSVLVAENGTAHSRLVTTGERRKEAVEVLSGLNAGEKVVVPAPPDMADGTRVEVRQ